MKRAGTDSDGNFIHDTAKIDDSVVMGRGNIFGPNVYVGPGCTFGDYNILRGDVILGPDCEVESHVELRAETLVEEGVRFDSGAKCSGQAHIRAHATIRYDAIIARGCVVGEHTYVCPQVMTNNLSHEMQPIGGAKIGAHCFIGTASVLGAGIEIAPGSVVGTMSNVTKSIEKPGVYFGNPAALRWQLNVPDEALARDEQGRYLVPDGPIRDDQDFPLDTDSGMGGGGAEE